MNNNIKGFEDVTISLHTESGEIIEMAPMSSLEFDIEADTYTNFQNLYTYGQTCTLTVQSLFLDGIMLAEIYGAENEPSIKKYINLYHKAKKKRIKKKLNKRVLIAIAKYLCWEE